MALLQIDDLSFTYGGAAAPALKEIGLSVNAGDFVLLCGQSGCGKTTLLSLLKPALSPCGEQGGQVIYDGQPLSGLSAAGAAGEIGMVMQYPAEQVVADTVERELVFAAENIGLPPSLIRRRVAEMAGFFGIGDWLHRRTATLSGGQLQLLNLAAVMVTEPRVLLLDEPTAQLDPIAAKTFVEMLARLNRELGLTVIVAEHRLEEMLPLATTVVVMDNGRCVCAVPPRQLAQALDGHVLQAALPAPLTVFRQLGGEGNCPLTVREGRDWLHRHADNRVADTAEHPSKAAGRPLLTAADIWFRYDKSAPDVLRGLQLTVHEGEALCILGGNGSGKSTLLRVLAGLHRPYRGSVRWEGKPLTAYKENLYRGGVALLPQAPEALFLQPSVREDFEDYCRATGTEKSRIDAVCEQLPVRDWLSRHPFDLSGGERQLCALAKLLLSQPKLLLLDEPVKGLDACSKQRLRQLLRKLQAQGTTVVAVTHDVEFAALYADRCALLFDGEIVCEQAPADFFDGNRFYTTAANRMARPLYRGVLTAADIVMLCRRNRGETL